MTREEVFERLNDVFRDEFDDEELTVTDATVAQDVDGWDSLAHINLMAAIEDEFDIKFGMKEVNNMKNVGEMVDIILARLS